MVTISISVIIPTKPPMSSSMFCMLYTTMLPKKKLSPNNTTPNSNKGMMPTISIVMWYTYSLMILNALSILNFFIDVVDVLSVIVVALLSFVGISGDFDFFIGVFDFFISCVLSTLYIFLR